MTIVAVKSRPPSMPVHPPRFEVGKLPRSELLVKAHEPLRRCANDAFATDDARGTGRIHRKARTTVSVMRRHEVRDQVGGRRVLLEQIEKRPELVPIAGIDAVIEPASSRFGEGWWPSDADRALPPRAALAQVMCTGSVDDRSPMFI